MESQLISKLPEELRTKYLKYTRKSTPTIETLKIATALKLWNDRSFRDVQFDVPLVFRGRTVFAKVLAKNGDGVVFGVECASVVRLGLLRARIELLRACLQSDSYFIVVFPETAGERVDKAVKFADEVWVTGKNGVVAQMLFASVLHLE